MSVSRVRSPALPAQPAKRLKWLANGESDVVTAVCSRRGTVGLAARGLQVESCRSVSRSGLVLVWKVMERESVFL